MRCNERTKKKAFEKWRLHLHGARNCADIHASRAKTHAHEDVHSTLRDHHPHPNNETQDRRNPKQAAGL